MMTSDLQIIAAAFKQGGGGVPLLRKSISAAKEMKTADPGGALQSFQNRFSESTRAAEPPQTRRTEKSGHPAPCWSNWIPRADWQRGR